MRNASASNLRAAFHAAVIVGAMALPLVLLMPNAAHADTPKWDTLKEVTTKGSFLIIEGFAPIEVTYTPDGKFSAMGGQVAGTWRIVGETLCTTTSLQPAESCALYPKDKKSGDTFDLVTDQGVVQIRIK